jgi:hypothetical protein
MYEKIKRITIWIPALGVLLMLMCEKELNNKSMYDEYFEWGSPLLVLISAFWQAISVCYILLKWVLV